MNVGQPGLHRSLWQKEEVRESLKLADHMKGFQVGKQERIQNTKYRITSNSKCGDPRDHTAAHKQVSAWEMNRWVRMEDTLSISY